MNNRKRFFCVIAVVALLYSAAVSQELTPKEQLGKDLFFDTDLSVPPRQSCASCHDPAVGFTGPISLVNASGAVHPGAIPVRFGNRKPPMAAYCGESPVLHYDQILGKWVGGMFWDGRASGSRLGDPLAEQAQGPFLNPLEQNMPHARQVCIKVAISDYAGLFEEVWGLGSLDFARDVDGVYERIAHSVAAYERSSEVSPFTSKFDLFWDNAITAGLDVSQIGCAGSAMGGCGMGGGGGGMGGGGGGGGGNTIGW